MLSLQALAASIERGELKEAVEAVKSIRPERAERLYPLAWLALRAWSMILNVFGGGKPPSTEELSMLEVKLTQLAVEAFVMARRGVVDERYASELVALLTNDKFVSLLRSCRAGSCNPRLVSLHGERFKLLGEVLALAGGVSRDCIPG